MALDRKKRSFSYRSQKQSRQTRSAGLLVAKHPQGVRKSNLQTCDPPRSVRLNPASDKHTHQQYPPTTEKTLQKSGRSAAPQPRGRKRLRESEDQSVDTAIVPSSKKSRESTRCTPVRPVDQETQFQSTEAHIDPIDYWRREQTWPEEYFKLNTMSHLLPRKKSTSSRERSASGSSITPSDQKPREEKSAPYQDARYETLLQTKRSFMDTSKQGIVDASKAQCRELIEKEQDVPQESLFRDDLFESTCRKIQSRNEARVIRDISMLIVPSAETLATYGAEELEILIDSTNEGWNNSVPLIGTRPQPDHSVGFRREAFTEDQLKKLSPFIGDFIAGDQSYFMATYFMYFPFLTCEVKCGDAALEIADRQNAHSMTLAVRAVVELFRLVKREKQINREILAFSISHDHASVRIYGHYAIINGKDTAFYRQPIRQVRLHGTRWER